MRTLIAWATAVLAAQSAQRADFRQTHWGMSKTEVRAVETARPTADPDQEEYLLYRASVEGLNCLLGYVFVNDQLVRAVYVIDQKHTDLIDYLSDYQRLKQALSEQYGRPAEDEEIWSNNLYQGKPAEFGNAVSLGHLKRFTAWKTASSDINIFLTGNNRKIDLSVDYSSTRLTQPNQSGEKSGPQEF
jgi:hypothetical protein